MEREDIFDEVFCSKLKAFYSYDEGNRVSLDMGYRRTGRTFKLAKILLETAIESGREIEITDHYLDTRGMRDTVHHMRRAIEKVAYNFRQEGVLIEYRFGRGGDTFTAYLAGGGDAYHRLRHNPFPIRLLQERKEFLNKKLLLLL